MKGLKSFLVLLLGILFTKSISAVEVSSTVEKTFQVKPGSQIVLLADEGDVVVSSWSKDEVFLKMTKRAWGRSQKEAERHLEMLEVQIQERRDCLVIKQLENEYHRQFNAFDIFEGKFWRERRWQDYIIDFELVVPKNMNLKLTADEGDIRVAGVTGELILELDEGDIEVENVISEQMDIQVDEGDIFCTECFDEKKGVFMAQTDEGNIYLENVKIDELDINTDEGDIDLQNIIAFKFWISSDEGDIEVQFSPVIEGNYRLQNEEGNIDISFLNEPNLYVRLRTDEGSIDTNFNLHSRYEDDAEMAEGVIGKEQGALKAFTDEGDICLSLK